MAASYDDDSRSHTASLPAALQLHALADDELDDDSSGPPSSTELAVVAVLSLLPDRDGLLSQAWPTTRPAATVSTPPTMAGQRRNGTEMELEGAG